VMDGPTFLFWLFAAVIVVGAVGVVSMRQPVHSALFLLLSFLGVACLFLLERAEFLAAVQILVYAGGIMVLFLFTIMLVNVRRQEGEPYLHGRAWKAVLAGALLFGLVGSVLLDQVNRTVGKVAAADGDKLASTIVDGKLVTGNSQVVAWLLYRDYLLPFEVASVLLLVAMIGAVVLGKRTMERFD
jgi:NADH-quinone oxidoreductase subunit J